MKVAVYTCITGAYDSLRPPRQVQPGLDYFCFSDPPLPTCPPWQAVPVDVPETDAPARNRRIKMLAHRQPTLAAYAASLYVDGSIEIVGDLSQFIASCDARPEPIQLYRHPFRDCIYDEALACARAGHVSFFTLRDQMGRYRRAGFPEHHGLFEAGVLYRRHVPEVDAFMEAWWDEYRTGARRDQLSLPFLAWQAGLAIGDLGPSDPRFGRRTFRLHAHRAVRVPLRASVHSRLNRLLLAVLGQRRLLGHDLDA
jgi:hypothetical protein